MKEATGEANMTVITIVLIGVIAAIATPLITSLVNSAAKSACCTGAGYSWEGGCKDANGNAVSQDTYWDSTTNKCK